MSNPSQLLLLCDHIKLSLLERQRAISLNLTPNSGTDSNISRSLDSLHEGIESLAQRSSDTDSISNLRNQYNDLSRQFHGENSTTAEETMSFPTDPSLRGDFAHAKSRTSIDNNTTRPPIQTRTSNLKPTSKNPDIHSPQPHSAKNVRFRDDPSEEDDLEARAALFPSRYTDDEDRTTTPDPTGQMDNQQIHAYHQQVLTEQDDQLDRLGESIGRQRHLSMAIGDELDGQAELLEDVERGVDRHQGRLDLAKRRLNGVAKKASQNWGMTTIVLLIVILVLLIVILKRGRSRQVWEDTVQNSAAKSAVSRVKSGRAEFPASKDRDALLLLAALVVQPKGFCSGRGQDLIQPSRLTFANIPPQMRSGLYSLTFSLRKSDPLLQSKYRIFAPRDCELLSERNQSLPYIKRRTRRPHKAQEKHHVRQKPLVKERSRQGEYYPTAPDYTGFKGQKVGQEDQRAKVPKQPNILHTVAGEGYRGLQEPVLGQREEMTKPDQVAQSPSKSATGGHDKPLVVGRTKPTDTPAMDSSKQPTSVPTDTKAALNHAIETNVQGNTKAAAPADSASDPSIAASRAPSAPFTPALIDLRVGHILRCVTHPNADSLFVSTIAMGDAEGTDYTQIDDETGKVVRTVCSGLNGLIPIEEMQDRKIIVVANLKPVTMRGIKSAAMVLAASPRVAEGEDDHAADRTVELVMPPDGSEAGDKVYFEGWPYGEGRGPEKQLNPKKKQWEGIQPGFYTSEDLVVGFDAGQSEVGGEEKGDLVVEGKGKCLVKTLKGAIVR